MTHQLFLAMSCLQSRLQSEAFAALIALEPDGIQLTPGNLPTAHFADEVRAWGKPVRPHHGFVWHAYRAEVYDAACNTLFKERHRSIHPPKCTQLVMPVEEFLDQARAQDLLLETMYPGYVLGTGAELTYAMDVDMRLAVDISHIHIQACQGVLHQSVVDRLLSYHRIEEVHVSANAGVHDSHAPITAHTPHLAWAQGMLGAVPVVLECYMHKLTVQQRQQQVALLRDQLC